MNSGGFPSTQLISCCPSKEHRDLNGEGSKYVCNCFHLENLMFL